jgi:hypothetical protein
MNNTKLGIRVRLEAAAKAAPFCHARLSRVALAGPRRQR